VENGAKMDDTLSLIESIGEQLRAKILSKFQTSAFLAGLAVAVLGVQLATLADTSQERSPLFWVSIALMFGALVVYVAALIKLDELTLPKRFWQKNPDDPVPQRYSNVLLNDRDLILLRRRMVFHWYTLTLTATGITGLALLLLLVPANWITSCLRVGPEGTFAGVIAVLGLTLLYLFVLSRIVTMHEGWFGKFRVID
jgi:drug/metabolite transporter (DMT)-like permease